MDFKVTSAATAAVYNAIGVGRENATSRGDLVRQTGLPDRAVRRAIDPSLLRTTEKVITSPYQTIRDGKKLNDG